MTDKSGMRPEQLVGAICSGERRLQESRDIASALRARRSITERELERLRREVANVSEALQRRGRSRFEWGDFARLTPISDEWGADRGQCVDRYYIEQFLAAHAEDVGGAVLEVHDSDYTIQYGGERVTRSDIIDIDSTNARATVVADLTRAEAIADHTYDCFIMTQTLHFIYDVRAVLRESVRILRPGGVLLATLACASRIAPEQGLDGDFWRFTESAARRLFDEFFDPQAVQIRSYGNVLVTIAFLYGLAAHELSPAEFEAHDPYFPLIIGVRARTRSS